MAGQPNAILTQSLDLDWTEWTYTCPYASLQFKSEHVWNYGSSISRFLAFAEMG